MTAIKNVMVVNKALFVYAFLGGKRKHVITLRNSTPFNVCNVCVCVCVISTHNYTHTHTLIMHNQKRITLWCRLDFHAEV